MATSIPASTYPGGPHALLQRARQAQLMEGLCESDAELLAGGTLVRYQPDEQILAAGVTNTDFRIVLEGRVQLQRQSDPEFCSLSEGASRACIGEISLLTGKPGRASLKAETEVLVLSLSNDAFWRLLVQCPAIRVPLVGQFVHRIANMQTVAMQREKMMTVGLMTAGLMHELNNPGTAARRATSQLRENLSKMQETALRISAQTQTPDQKSCVHALLVRMFGTSDSRVERSSLETADREEDFCSWMEENHVPDCWKIAPVLANSSLSRQELDCARSTLPPEMLADVLGWLEALGSSTELLQTIETSMQRITDLVSAVKSYSSGAASFQAVDYMDTMRAAWMIVKHKFVTKNIQIEKSYAPEPAKIFAPGIAQVWTNLLDNAADAVPETGGRIFIRSQVAGGHLTVEIEDNGSGIPADTLPRIFDPFYTTKDVGKGTGLGLDIVHRAVTSAGGTIDVEAHPGHTVFRVTLPVHDGEVHLPHPLEEKAESQHA